jgi:hypothetical protein
MAHIYRDLPAAGTRLQLETGYAFADVPGVTDISIDGFKRGVRSPTLLTSPAVVKKPGMPNFGTLKCKVFYDPNDATHQDMITRLTESAAVASANLDSWKIIYPDGFTTPANWEFQGFVSDFSLSATDPETGSLTADMSVEISDITGFVAGLPAE